MSAIMAAMDKPKPSIETLDDTPIDQDQADLSDVTDVSGVAPTVGADRQGAQPSIELAIETLAGLDAAEAPDRADELAGRLRAELSDS